MNQLRNGLGLLALCALAACSFQDSRAHCLKNSDCSAGQECLHTFCIRSTASKPASPAAGGGGSTASNAGNAGKPAKDPVTGTTMNPSVGTGGADPSAPTTVRDAGTSDPVDAMMSVMPLPSTDAMVMTPADAMVMSPLDSGPDAGCSEGQTRICSVSAVGTAIAARCTTGTQRCSAGSFGGCVADVLPSAETCNGVDDDCDEATDEKISMPCYPTGVVGCTLAADNTGTCAGICKLGTATCAAGQFGGCLGATTPQPKETCTESGTAADENCDGSTDENCVCSGTEMRSCYTGPAGTAGVGKCIAGTQRCSGGNFSACAGAVGPIAESCLNEGGDDDCDGTADNIRERGAVCTVASNHGPCQQGVYQCQPGMPNLVCVTTAATTETCNGTDDNCDGRTDETFDLLNDPAHCGSCTIACPSGNSCCAGHCIDTKLDDNNCGGCGTTYACAAGSGCCDGKCMDLSQDATNCGACGRPCGKDESCCGGTCANTNTDLLHCGKCTIACGADAKACCSGVCKTLTTDDACGSCGNACGLLGALCHCKPVDNTVDCRGDALNLCVL